MVATTSSTTCVAVFRRLQRGPPRTHLIDRMPRILLALELGSQGAAISNYFLTLSPFRMAFFPRSFFVFLYSVEIQKNSPGLEPHLGYFCDLVRGCDFRLYCSRSMRSMRLSVCSINSDFFFRQKCYWRFDLFPYAIFLSLLSWWVGTPLRIALGRWCLARCRPASPSSAMRPASSSKTCCNRCFCRARPRTSDVSRGAWESPHPFWFQPKIRFWLFNFVLYFLSDPFCFTDYRFYGICVFILLHRFVLDLLWIHTDLDTWRNWMLVVWVKTCLYPISIINVFMAVCKCRIFFFSIQSFGGNM